MGFWDSSGISWTMCKQSAPLCRQVTTPAPHNLQAGCSSWCPANSVKALKAKHWILASYLLVVFYYVAYLPYYLPLLTDGSACTGDATTGKLAADIERSRSASCTEHGTIHVSYLFRWHSARSRHRASRLPAHFLRVSTV